MTEHYSHVGNDEKSAALAKVISLVRAAPARALAEVGVLVGVEAQNAEGLCERLLGEALKIS